MLKVSDAPSVSPCWGGGGGGGGVVGGGHLLTLPAGWALIISRGAR